jgi:FAD/FMN-containing dehydrogenase
MATATHAIEGFRGTLIAPDDVGYDAARAVFNGMVDRRPSLIARCRSTADVVAAVRHGAAAGHGVSVYGGGHSVLGSAVADGVLCVDLRGLDACEVDPVHRTVKAGGGMTWGALDAACQEHGLAVTGGRVSTTGIGGLALGSGSGWLERSLGFTCDNLLDAEVVTADGRVVHASATDNPDLFWAVRGGGGNVGVVTTFTLRLHPVGPIVLGGMLLYPMEHARDVVRAYRDFAVHAPDALGTGLAFVTAPPHDPVPPPVQGQPVIGVVVCFTGPPENGREALAPLLAAAPPAADLVQPMPYVAVQQLLDPANPKGMRNYWSGDFFDSLDDDAVDVLVSHASRPLSPMTQVILVPMGGAVARVPEGSTAFGQRTAAFNIHYLGMWADAADDEANIASMRALSSAMKPWTTGGAYLNFLGDEGLDRIRTGLGGETFARLRRVKRDWDPGNVFRYNQNIPPAVA